MQEVKSRARERFHGKCRVCPKCNGVACAGEIPGMGGVRTGQTFIDNVEDWKKYGIIMQTMSGVNEPDTSVSLWGMELAMPVMVAPIGGVSFNMTEEMTEEEYCEAVCVGANKAGVMAWTGDSGVAGIFEAGLAQLEATAGRMIPTIKPRENAEIVKRANQAIAMGAKVLACDMDSAVLINMRRFGQPVETKSVDQWRELIRDISVPFILKGIMTGQEAVLAINMGAAGVVVSNHGGRILDGMASTASVLEEIVDAVDGKIPVIVDGGIRTGEDVFKAVALGADAVLIGRPAAVAAVGGGADGVTTYIGQLHREFADAMMMTGCDTVKDIKKYLLKKKK